MLFAVPAQQRFEADDLLVLGTNHRLVMQHEFVILERAAQREFELAAFLGMGMQRGLVAKVNPTAIFLGAVERKVGVRISVSTVVPSRGPIAEPTEAPM
jgi:hypothetical protein